MKSFQCFVFVLAVVFSLAGAFPKGKTSTETLDEETVIVPLEAQREGNSEPNTHIIIGGFGPPLTLASTCWGFGPQYHLPLSIFAEGKTSTETLDEETVIVPLEAQREGNSEPNTHIIIGGFGPPLNFGAPLVGGFGPQFGEISPFVGIPPHEPPFLAGVPQPAPSVFAGLNPFGNGGGFLGGLESGLALMRRQLSTILNHVPGVGNPAQGDGNTTSSTKVIDGHRITINETVYSNGYDGSVFKVRVVDVHPEKPDHKPSEEEDGAEVTTTNPKLQTEKMGKIDSVEVTTETERTETINDSGIELSENSATEISTKENTSESGEKLSNDINEKSEEVSGNNASEDFQENVSDDKSENFDRSTESLDVSQSQPIQPAYPEEVYDYGQEILSVPSPDEWNNANYQYEDLLDTNEIQHADNDLSNDIAINDIAAAAGVTADPQSELIDVFQGDKFADEIAEVETNERKFRSLNLKPIK
ncbi:uncharacterized protein LOC113386147 [Ctenocephalides felis]|uniref:uncharacterized protein LOC113386147 n=1 Tax=Ctenocephalides felis TaxID=7515 RepID=UPI000E6E3BA2|nr:uncharacterized protein LOC113386147 [Ctenocephalides felis]